MNYQAIGAEPTYYEHEANSRSIDYVNGNLITALCACYSLQSAVNKIYFNFQVDRSNGH